MADPDFELLAGLEIDPRAFATITQQITRSIEKGFAGVEKSFASAMVKNLVSGLRKAEAPLRAQAKTFDQAGDAARKYGTDISQVEKRLVDFGREVRDSVKDSATVISTLVQRAGIEQNQALQAQLFERLQAERKGASLVAIEAQKAAQSQIIAQRQSGQQRIQLTRFALETMGRLEKAFGATVGGVARTAVAAIGRSVDGLGRVFRRSSQDLNAGLGGALSRREQSLRESFRRQEITVRTSLTRSEQQIEAFQRKMSTGVTGAVTGRGIGGGLGMVAGGAGIFGLLTSGFSKFSELERINKQFLALTGNLEDTNMLMDQIKEYAKVTPFDVVGVADLAKGFLAIGTEAENVLPMVQSISDAVALTGGGTEELIRLQRAIGQVVSAGRLQGDELNQIAENLPGLNIRKILADQLTDGDQAALVEMQAAGEISADAFVTALITGLAGDPRLEGAAEDMSKTLGGRLANLKESFANFGATLIGLVQGPLKGVFAGLESILLLAGAFVSGEDLGVLAGVLRNALGGVAAGMLAIVAAKGAIEVIGLLRLALTALVSPLGLALVAAGAVGAAISVMSGRSEAFRESLGLLGERIRDLGSRIVGQLTPYLERFSQFIDTRVIPAIDRFADWVGENLNSAIDSVIRFVTSTAIPALASFARFVAGTLAPIVAAAAKVVADAFIVVRDAVQRFVDFALPYLAPAIEGFRALGGAIGDAFGGEFGGLGRGLGAAVSGIGSTVAVVARSVVEALAPVGERVMAFLRNLFSGENLIQLAGGFLDVVEEIGRILGLIASDPRLLAALLAIAAAAAVVAVRFAKGFAEGVLENVPKILSGASELLSKALAEAIANPKILGLAIVAIFTYATILRPLIAAFSGLGAQSAGAFAKSFGSTLAGARQYQNALFGGPMSAGVARDARTYPAMREEARALTAQIRALGGEMAVLPIASKKSTEGLVAGRLELKRLSEGLTASEISALRFRDSTRQAFGAVRTAASGVAGGIGMIGRAIGESFDRSRFSQVMNGIVADARQFLNFGGPRAEEFKGRGAAAGEAFVGGMRAQLRTGIRQVGSSIAEGFRGLQNAARDSGVAIGQNVAFGLAAGLGGFIAGRAEGQAGGSGILSALGSGLGAAALGASGPVAIAVAGVALLGAEIGRMQAAAKAASERIKGFSDIIEDELVTAVNAGSEELGDFYDAFILLGPETQQEVWGQVAAGIEEYNATLLEAGVTMGQVRVAFQQGDDAVRRLATGIALSGDNSVESLAAAAALANQYKAVTAAIEDAEAAARFNAVVNPTSPFAATVQAVVTGATERTELEKDIAARRQFQDAMDSYYRSTRDAAREQAILNAETARTEVLEAYRSKMAELELQADRTSDAIAEAMGVRDPQGFDAVVDSAILSLQGAFGELSLGDNLFDQAKLDTELSTFKGLLSTAAQQAFIENPLISADQLGLQLLPVLAAALDGVDDESLRTTLTTAFEEGVAGANLAISEDQFAQLSQGLLEAGDLSVPIKADTTEFDSTISNLDASTRIGFVRIGVNAAAGMKQGIASGRAGVVAEAVKVAQAAVVAVEGWLGIESPSRVMAELGAFTSEGFALGIASGADAVGVAARDLATTVTGTLGDDSREVGRSIGQAIVDGFAEELTDLASVATSAVDEALLKALGGDPKQRGARSATARLFDQLTGSDSEFSRFFGSGFNQQLARADLTDARTSFLSTFDSNASRIFDVNAKKPEELTASERQVFGQDLFSLDPSAFFGASNLQSLTGAFDSILDFGEALISQGVSVDEVTKQVRQQSEEMIWLAGSLGFSGDQVRSLAESLGLSDLAINDFLTKVREMQTNLSNTPTPTDEDTAGLTPAVVEQLAQLQRPVINYIYLPTGDPEANALAVSNQQAYAARLP